MGKSTPRGFLRLLFTVFIIFGFLSFIHAPQRSSTPNAEKRTTNPVAIHSGSSESTQLAIEAARYHWMQRVIQPVSTPASATMKSVTTQTVAFNWCSEAESGSGNRNPERNSQASGGQLVGGFGGSNEYMSYTLSNVPSAGNYTLHVWYSSAEKPQFGLVVNAVLQTVAAAGNGSWTGPFLEKLVPIALQAGTNTVRIQGVGAGANFTLDRLCVDGGPCTPPSLRLNSVGCTGSRTYAVGFTTQSDAIVTTSAGRVEDDQIVNIPVGTPVTVTASLDGCSTQQVAQSPTCGTACGSGSGLTATYYNTSDLSQTPVVTRTDAQINFFFGAESPIPGVVNTNNFSIRWEGQIEVPVTTTYTFLTNNDEATRLWIDGQLLIDDWKAHTATVKQNTISLTAGKKYAIKLEFADFSGDAQALLYWQYKDQPMQIVPSCWLYPRAACTPPNLILTTLGCTGSSTYAVNFVAQSGATVTTSAGRVEDDQVVGIPVGTNATVMASLDGCSAQQIAQSPTCGSTEGVYNYPIPITPNTWPTYNSDVLSGQPVGDVVRLESSDLIVEVRKRYGGAIQIIDKATGKKLVNWTDWGRQNELSLYGGPANFSNDVGSKIGWNPLTVGDIGQNGAPVVGWGFVTGNDRKQRLYIRTRMISWPHSNAKLLEAYNERWIALTGKEIDVIARVTFSRADQNFYVAQMQEYPCFFRSGKNNLMRWYNGKEPYTNGALTQTTTLESPTRSFEAGGYFRMTEPWIAMEQDGVNIFLNTDKFAQSSASVDRAEWSNDNSEGAYQYTYCQAANTLTIDPNGILLHHYGFYVTSAATFQEGRDWANARPRKYGDVPNFTFDVAHGRNDWYVGNGTDQREPFTAAGWDAVLVPTADGGPLTARRSSLNSPVGIWKASRCPLLYVKLKYSGQENQLRVNFVRNGQSDVPPPRVMTSKFVTWYPNGYPAGVQYFNITPIKDGQYHTYVINTSANPEWKDIIQSFSITYGNGNAVIPQEPMSLLYFGVTNTNQ